MDFITRQLRSQVCVQAHRAGDDRRPRRSTRRRPTSVTFFSDLSDESVRTGNTLRPPGAAQPVVRERQADRAPLGGHRQPAPRCNPTYSYTGYPGHADARRRVLATTSPRSSKTARRPAADLPLLQVSDGGDAGHAADAGCRVRLAHRPDSGAGSSCSRRSRWASAPTPPAARRPTAARRIFRTRSTRASPTRTTTSTRSRCAYDPDAARPARASAASRCSWSSWPCC